jgi:choline kinase
VNNSAVGEEEVKYNLDENGFIKNISKKVKHALGEAVGINFIGSNDIGAFISRLEECENSDYFERGLELAIEKDKIKVLPHDVSSMRCMEIDFREDLENVNRLFK